MRVNEFGLKRTRSVIESGWGFTANKQSENWKMTHQNDADDLQTSRIVLPWSYKHDKEI